MMHLDQTATHSFHVSVPYSRQLAISTKEYKLLHESNTRFSNLISMRCNGLKDKPTETPKMGLSLGLITYLEFQLQLGHGPKHLPLYVSRSDKDRGSTWREG